MSTKPKKTNLQGSSSLEELLIKRLDPTARKSIELISKEMDFKFGTGDWSTEEAQKKILHRLRQYLPNADEETYLICQAVLVGRTAEAFLEHGGIKTVYGSNKSGSAAQQALQREVEKEIQDSKEYWEEEEEQHKEEHLRHLTDIIKQLYKLHKKIKDNSGKFK